MMCFYIEGSVTARVERNAVACSRVGRPVRPPKAWLLSAATALARAAVCSRASPFNRPKRNAP